MRIIHLTNEERDLIVAAARNASEQDVPESQIEANESREDLISAIVESVNRGNFRESASATEIGFMIYGTMADLLIAVPHVGMARVFVHDISETVMRKFNEFGIPGQDI